MPVYEARCVPCGSELEYVSPISDRNDVPRCPDCLRPMGRAILSAPMSFAVGKFEPFISHVDGTLISTHMGLKEHNRRNNVVNLADGYDDETIKAGNYIPKEVKDVEDTKRDVAESIHKLKSGYKPTLGVP